MKHLCLNCERGDMVRYKKDCVLEYRGHRAIIREIDGWHCPECVEIEFAKNEGARYAEALERLQKKVGVEESAELAGIRKKLKLSQRRAAEIAGGGVNAFSRYENGKAKPVAAVVNLFRILDKHLELINGIPA